MSDTSEAPSLASHVRRVRVPSQASDVDQFLDDLFMPVLDGNIDDGLSDARSLAASMRGGGEQTDKAGRQAQAMLDLNRMGSFRRQSVLLQCSDSESEEETVENLLERLRGGGSPGTEAPASPRKQSDFVPLTNSAMGFHPIPGVISPHPVSGMVSPPPMMIPTPMMPGGHSMYSMNGTVNGVNGGMTSPLLMPAENQQAAMAFTYVPVPVYNLSGMGMSPGMMPGMMPGMVQSPGMGSMNYVSLGTTSLPTSGPASPTKQGEQAQPAATSTPMSPQPSNLSVPDNQMAYQQAFLQNAVAQNMQIQQQLILQNQALSQLLQQTSISSPPQHASMSPKQQQDTPSPSKPAPVYFGMNEAQRRSSEIHLNTTGENHMQSESSKMRSKTAPSTPKNSTGNMPPQAPQLPPGGPMDAYTRARTVRIGKWRWPPPKEDGDALAEGFFQFKMRKMKQREGFEDSGDGVKNESLETSGEIQGLDWGEIGEEFHKGLKRSQSKDSFTIMEDTPDSGGDRTGKNKSPDGSTQGNVGKLKISNEMKEKLEAAMGGSKNASIASRKSSRGDLDISEGADTEEPEQAVRKLNENRKMLLQQKLGGGGKLKKWENIDQELHHRASEDNMGSRKSSQESQGGHIPVPPPPPIAPTFNKHRDMQGGGREASSPASSLYSPGGSTTAGIPDSRRPPPPVAPVLSGDLLETSRRAAMERERRSSTSSYHTEKTERFDLEESGEFLQAVEDPGRNQQNILDELDYQAMEEMQTRLHPPNSSTHFSYNRVPWKLKIRKEIFSPSEQLTNPTTIHLVFCQVVFDTHSPLCIRLTQTERRKMMGYMDKYDISPKNVHSSQHKNSTKVNIIAMAKDFSTYFSRIYPVASNDQEVDLQYLAVSHSGVKLIRREKSLPTDYLKVVDFYNFEDIASVETVKSSALQLVMHTGGRVVVTTNKATSIRDLITQFSVEARSGQYEYARALADYSSREDNALNFKAGDIVAVVPKEDAYTARGWLYGIKDGNYGVFPADYVDKMSPKSIRKEIKVISRITQASPRQRSPQKVGGDTSHREQHNQEDRQVRSPIDEADYSPEDTWNDRKARDSYDAGDTSDVSISAAKVSNDGKHPLLEFAMSYFRQSNFDQQRDPEEKSKKKKKKGSKNDWTWKDEVERVKWTDRVIEASLMRLEHHEMNKIAQDCFASILRYMGDLPLAKGQRDVDCALTILSLCYKFDDIKDEVYCQVMKQTTNNKSPITDSCQKGWRLFSIIAAYFICSDQLKPFLFKYLETAAYDKRRAYHGTALVCLHNLRKTFKYGGRQMAPSIEEITAITAGRNSKRQIYRLPGGTERVINTKSTTVVDDIVEDLCTVIGVTSPHEREEFSLYCIIEGQTFTRPLYKEQYILDVTTDLQKQGATYYLIFCRSVWHYPLRLDNKLYIEVVFNQIAPDYLEGLLLVMPSEQIDNEVVYQVAKVAALLHKAADMDHVPTLKETKFLLPKPALSARDIKPPQWVNMVQGSWAEVQDMSASQAKAQVLQILAQWQLFGSSFFAVRRDSDPSEGSEHILALNKHGVHFLDLITHETILHYPFTEVISTRQMETEDGVLYLDMKCGNLMQQRISRIQTDQAVEIARLIKQYITIDQRTRGLEKEPPTGGRESRGGSRMANFSD